MLKNDLLLKALRGEDVPRPPVWMMRQAGRFLPDYLKLKAKYDFFTRIQTPELATEITVMPVRQIGVDAAILFSDILVIPQAMGVEVLMEEGKGPSIPHPLHSKKDIDSLIVTDAVGRLDYVMDAVRLTKQTLNNEVPLIGFAGAPWTILCYLVEGKGSKTFDKARSFCYTHPDLADQLLSKITEVTIGYLKAKIRAGVDAVQVFDSWAGLLGPSDYRQFSLQYLIRIIEALRSLAPVIIFPKGAWFALEELGRSGASALGIDWCIDPAQARVFAGNQITLQGNFDPARLLAPREVIQKETRHMIRAFGKQRYIANLGHGILPHVPVDHAKIFVDTVKSYDGH
ncbi:MAG TPA: uroporphyrinogen decarboxylase [Cyclobacteriaceae bacterium]|nr:uroporphyrinogen decarboxylase [Cyclobacteriaceae bacterium]